MIGIMFFPLTIELRRPAIDQEDNFNEAIPADAGDYPSADVSSCA
jgi:hypothetical protein